MRIPSGLTLHLDEVTFCFFLPLFFENAEQTKKYAGFPLFTRYLSYSCLRAPDHTHWWFWYLCTRCEIGAPLLFCCCAVIRLFGGLILDIKRKAPFYLSDFKDGMSLQCVASFLFLYCACMSPVITFGGLLGEATEGRIVRAQTHSLQCD